MNRRGFFQKIAQAIAVVSLAPRLAFRVPDEAVFAVRFRSSSLGVYEMLKICEKLPRDPKPLDLPDFFKQLYAIKAQRDKEGHLCRW